MLVVVFAAVVFIDVVVVLVDVVVAVRVRVFVLAIFAVVVIAMPFLTKKYHIASFRSGPPPRQKPAKRTT